MAATDPSAVFFCAHDSHDKRITTPVNGYHRWTAPLQSRSIPGTPRNGAAQTAGLEENILPPRIPLAVLLYLTFAPILGSRTPRELAWEFMGSLPEPTWRAS
jgi:hypothetical protein